MEFKTEILPQDFNESIKSMEKRVNHIIGHSQGEMAWILDYPAIYTCGASENNNDLLDSSKFPVFKTNRGGKYTYHGPGQRVIYLMIDLNQRNKDIRKFLRSIENIILRILARFETKGILDDRHHGVFVKKDDGNLYKIASIGMKFKKWVSYHGFSFNINPNLEHYSGIKPCGLNKGNMTSLSDIGIKIGNNEFDAIVIEEINSIFGI